MNRLLLDRGMVFQWSPWNLLLSVMDLYIFLKMPRIRDWFLIFNNIEALWSVYKTNLCNYFHRRMMVRLVGRDRTRCLGDIAGIQRRWATHPFHEFNQFMYMDYQLIWIAFRSTIIVVRGADFGPEKSLLSGRTHEIVCAFLRSITVYRVGTIVRRRKKCYQLDFFNF